MNLNKALWEKGDFTRIAASMRESGARLVERIGVSKGLKVLDLGCGDGTTAIPAAQRGADVLGVDISTKMVAAGNRRRAGANSSTTGANDLRQMPSTLRFFASSEGFVEQCRFSL